MLLSVVAAARGADLSLPLASLLRAPVHKARGDRFRPRQRGPRRRFA
jgi:hypothetical protein